MVSPLSSVLPWVARGAGLTGPKSGVGAWVLGLSAGMHVAAGWALGVMPSSPHGLHPVSVEIQMVTAVVPVAAEPPAAEPPEPPIARPTPVPEARPRVLPRRVEPLPEAPPPPAADDVFAEPAGPPPTLTSLTGSGPSMPAGDPEGMVGGVHGGHGTEISGPLGEPAPAITGPSEADRRRARRAYVRSLEGLLGGHVRYPRAALRDRLMGRVELCLRIAEDGRVLGRRVCSSAGAQILDDAALEAASQIDRVPAPPALAAWTGADEIHAGVAFVVR